MIDFKKLIKSKVKKDVENLIELFNTLDRQTSHIELRTIQQQTLKMLSDRRNEHDLILKLSTGTGKTTIALLYLLSFMEALKRPVVYLCPTRQLTKQVQAEAEKLGIRSIIYAHGETYPDIEGTSGKAIIICTYKKLFNAKTTFDRVDVMLRPCAFVLDDAHSGIEEIRASFTLSISGDSLHQELLKIFNDSCKRYNYGLWNDIFEKGESNALMEIPFWIWKPLLPEVERTISQFSEEGSYKFVIPYIRDVLKWCRCVISGKGIEIIPDILSVHKSDAFIRAEHRLFMSATLADDSILIRELGCDLFAAENPILPESDKGLGERMVLAPSLLGKELDRNWVIGLSFACSKQVRVVVLAQSEQKAKDWEKQGATIFMGDNVLKGIEELNKINGEIRFVVFVQRYDGIDLPDSSCRVLVLDGLPFGEGLVDKFDSNLRSIAGGIRNRLIYRIEQGMGRAVRSHADYAVILLAGPELAHFIAINDVLSAMNPDTQAQLRLAAELAKRAKDDPDVRPADALLDLINQCLGRDEGWKEFYNQTIRNIEKGLPSITDQNRLLLANAERIAFEAALNRDFNKAVAILREAINAYIKDDKYTKGWYLQRVSNYLYEVDPGVALEVQRSAYENNRSMSCPPSITKRPILPEKYNIQTVIIDWFKQFQNPNGAIACIQELRAVLSYGLSSTIIEQRICDLAQLIGAEGSRPEKEYGEGPDDLWLWSPVYLVIEAKNENEESLHKKDAGQLLLSIAWFKKNYPTFGEPIPIIVAKVSVSDRNSGFPVNTRVITQDKMNALLDSLEILYNRIISEPVLATNQKLLAEAQQKLKLMPDQFISNFTVKLQELKN